MTIDRVGHDSTVFGSPNREWVFEWRPAHIQHQRSESQRRLVRVLAVVIPALLALMFWQLWLIWQMFSSQPEFLAKLKTLDWLTLKKSEIFKLTVELPIILIAGMAAWWVQRRSRSSRLHLNSKHLTQTSGLPRWLGDFFKQNWTLSLDEFRTGRLAFTLSGSGRGLAPLAGFVLTWDAHPGESAWRKAVRGRPQLLPASWFSIGEPAREPLVALRRGFFSTSLHPWANPQNQARLQQAFDQLPVLVALRSQGVPLPAAPTATRIAVGDGVDLMAYPRLKAVVLGFFALLIAAGLAYHFMRHQHYFAAPAFWVWAAFGAACAWASWRWLGAEQVPALPSFKPTQALVAGLLGVAAALLAPSALLALNLALSEPQSVAVSVYKEPLQLVPDDPAIPAFAPAQAREFWAAQAGEVARRISVREGVFGTWQYDSEPLEDEMHAFYRNYSSPAPAPAPSPKT